MDHKNRMISVLGKVMMVVRPATIIGAQATGEQNQVAGAVGGSEWLRLE